MIKPFLIVLAIFFSLTAHAQQVDSIYYHPYTDSLKPGTYNYINIDGKTTGGQWVPLTGKELNFSADTGTFRGNSLFIPLDFEPAKVTVKTSLKANPALLLSFVIYVKRTR